MTAPRLSQPASIFAGIFASSFAWVALVLLALATPPPMVHAQGQSSDTETLNYGDMYGNQYQIEDSVYLDVDSNFNLDSYGEVYTFDYYDNYDEISTWLEADLYIYQNGSMYDLAVDDDWSDAYVEVYMSAQVTCPRKTLPVGTGVLS